MAAATAEAFAPTEGEHPPFVFPVHTEMTLTLHEPHTDCATQAVMTSDSGVIVESPQKVFRTTV